MPTLKIEVSEAVRHKLVQQGVEELAGKDNWLTYINLCLHNYQNEELMREVYAVKRRLALLRKKSDKTEAEIKEEVKLLHQWQSESSGKKLTRIHNDNLFFKQRHLLFAGEGNIEKVISDKKSMWSLWMRFSDLLNEKLIFVGESPVIDKDMLQAVCHECSSMIFDHPKQLMADLKTLIDIQHEILDAAQSNAYLRTDAAVTYRSELKRVFDEVAKEKTKIITSLQKIQKSIFEGKTQNIAHQIKEKLDAVFHEGVSLPQKMWSEKELSIIKELHDINQKVFPPRITTAVYTVKDYIDICRVISPAVGLDLKEGKPAEIEMIPGAKPAFFRFGKNALFDIFSNSNAKALNAAYQDLEVLHALSLNNQNSNFMDEIIHVLPNYTQVFRDRLDQHKADVEQKIAALNANFISRFISEKECRELENWLVRLIRCSNQAEGIIQSITLSAMSSIDTPQKTQTVTFSAELEEREKQHQNQNKVLALETARLIQNSTILSAAYHEVIGNVSEPPTVTDIKSAVIKVGIKEMALC